MSPKIIWSNWQPANTQYGSGRGLQLKHNMVNTWFANTIFFSMRSANDTTWSNRRPANTQYGSGRGLQLKHNMVNTWFANTILFSMRSANDTTQHGQTGGLQTHTMVQKEACN
jgi:Rod binding domain-containing protein